MKEEKTEGGVRGWHVAGESKDVYALENFPDNFMGQGVVYGWQRKVLRALDRRGARVCLCAGNGTGKTSCVVTSAILHALLKYPGCKVVVTAGAYRQLSESLWPHIRTRTNALGGSAVGWEVLEDKVSYRHASGDVSFCISFSVTDPDKAESHHEMGRDSFLMYIIDEAKAVPDGVFAAAERCQPTVYLVVSSPGAPEGVFWKMATKGYGRMEVFKVQAMDCGHLTKGWVDTQVEMYGAESPLVRSMIYAEFVEEEGGMKVLGVEKMNAAVGNKVREVKGVRSAGMDFAAGGDENVFVVRNGNHVEKMVRWREKDTMMSVGRFITEIKQAGLEGGDCWADAGGMGIVMCDALRDAGVEVHRVNNGAAAFDSEKYANRGTEMWVRYARMIETGKVVPSEDEVTRGQLTARLIKYNAKGKLILESKDEMRARGVSSPDRADAVVLAFMGGGEFSLGDGVLNGGWPKRNFHEELDEAIDELRGVGGRAVMPGCEVA